MTGRHGASARVPVTGVPPTRSGSASGVTTADRAVRGTVTDTALVTLTYVRFLFACLSLSLSLVFSLCSSGLNSALLVLSNLSLSLLSLSLSLMKISSSPYIIFCGRRGVEHELTNFLCLSLHLSVCPFLRLSLCYIYT